jgi:quinoprotein glucose dehydrogenase
MEAGHDDVHRRGFESTPLVIDGTLYVTTPFNKIIAVDPDTGVERWRYDPRIRRAGDYGDGLINRGLATWADTTASPGGLCRRRLFEATLDARLVAVDAASGTPCVGFGTSGQVSLRDVGRYEPGVYHMTSPPAVVDDLVIVGSAINDNMRAHMADGTVRAFDARSGRQRWAWNPLAVDSGTSDAANAWSVMAVDPERHLVFVPTGSASPDYYGGQRPGPDKWANSIVALRAATGEVAWGFQLVHHDLWDYDTASPPLLATITRGGRSIPIVVQGNKTGFLYVLDRTTGEPVFPVEERPVPSSDIAGERASPTQPVPTAPPAIVPQRFAEADVWGATPSDREACLTEFRKLRNDGIFTPPRLQGSIVMPGMFGGMNWSGSAFDARHGLRIVSATVLPAKARLEPRRVFDDSGSRREDGDYATQDGTPYGLFRNFFLSPFFVAGTFDPHARAFDVLTGRELWRGELPTSGHATPITYQTERGTQYVVIAASGHSKLSEERLGDAVVAFALEKAVK